MIKIVRNICVLIVSLLVICLTIGTHVSTMQCTQGFSFYLGKEVPNCNIETKNLTCCKEEPTQELCCAKMNGCDQDTKLLQFIFETVVAKIQNITDFHEINLFIPTTNLCELSVNDNLLTHCDVESPPLLTKPILPKIQSFLL